MLTLLRLGQLVMGLNSLERITEYLELPQERSDGVVPPANWPSSAASALIVVDNLTVACVFFPLPHEETSTCLT